MAGAAFESRGGDAPGLAGLLGDEMGELSSGGRIHDFLNRDDIELADDLCDGVQILAVLIPEVFHVPACDPDGRPPH